MADVYQTEATRSLKAAGLWAEKFPDMRFLNRAGQVTTKDNATKREYPQRGRPDMYYFAMNRSGIGGFIEVKTGQGEHRQRFDFSEWRVDQREWYEKYGINLQVWLLIFLGKDIRSREYPRVAYLLHPNELLRVESSAKKKSIGYHEFQSYFPNTALKWAGNSTWEIPSQHAFMNQFR